MGSRYQKYTSPAISGDLCDQLHFAGGSMVVHPCILNMIYKNFLENLLDRQPVRLIAVVAVLANFLSSICLLILVNEDLPDLSNAI